MLNVTNRNYTSNVLYIFLCYMHFSIFELFHKCRKIRSLIMNMIMYIVGKRYMKFSCQRVNRETAPRKRDFASIVHRFTGHWRTQHTEQAQHSRSRVDDQVCRGSRSFSDWEVYEVPFPGQRESPASWPLLLLPCLSTTPSLAHFPPCLFFALSDSLYFNCSGSQGPHS